MSPGALPNLILTGFMGTGKTAVGREIARRTGRTFVDMDALIEAREGMAVTEIFRQQGEARFRQVEAELCHELAARTDPRGQVIATGGGALLRDLSRDILSASGSVVCLTASVDEVLRRVGGDSDRPLLAGPDRWSRVASLLEERAQAYQRIPLQVDTTSLTVAEVARRVLALEAAPQASAIPVRHPGGQYAVHLGRGLLAQVGPLLHQHGLEGAIALVTNPTLAGLHAERAVRSLEAAGFRVATCIVPDGEAAKTLSTVQTLYDRFIEAGLDRQAGVLALGGGVVGDLAGFAAATYLRGVALVQAPTTLLAMVDASVGGKVAVDHPRGKNLIGAFKQPVLVVADLETLDTLPEDERANGLAEVVKAGLVGDPKLFEQIERYGPAPLPWLVERALRVKVTIVQDDPHELGRRAVLNLGHTVGHALEALSEYELAHGSAVSIGLVAAARLSARVGTCPDGLPARVESVLASLGLPTGTQAFTPEQIWDAMATDKKRRRGRLRVVLLRDVGDVLLVDQIGYDDLLPVLESLRQS